jgi:hypothetical protein
VTFNSTRKYPPTDRVSPDAVAPNFLIVGASKAGTTTLYEWLLRHPEVFMSRSKEPSYFVEGYGVSFSQYFQLFETGRGKKAIGEASSIYLEFPLSAQWILEILGQVKIIMILRDPAERAFSLYSWMLMEGYEPCTSFERALDREKDLLPRSMEYEFFVREYPNYHYFYRESGMYYRSVLRFVQLFRSENVHVILFDDLKEQPQRVFEQACRFLGLAPGYRPDFAVHNVSVHPRHPRLQYALRCLAKRFRVPVPPVRRLLDWNIRAGHRPVKPASVIHRLRTEFAGDIQALEGLIERDLSKWYTLK